ncbi:MAG: tetraacyldisaccharide 4'-kinase [Acidaminococcales bacterium]|jgi:tetraacyldisaccharide 4'-kinase|nr:tetraacyldisaccharide 4'-kinase [Acidaminococcales bacterium]
MGFFRDDEISAVAGRNSIWIHGASVGEIVATSPLVKEIRKTFANVPIVVSAVTTGGYAMAKQIIPEADAVIFFPMDMPFVTGIVVERIRPRIFMPVETELWPNFLHDINMRGIPVMMVNGRISDKSVKTYKYLFGILDNMLNSVGRFCMQSALDAEYIMRLGADPKKVVITGNTKFDQTYAEVTPEDKQRFLVEMGIEKNHPVIVAGSTHPGEEKALVAAFAAVREKFPRACLLIAPRKPGRNNEIQAVAREKGFVCGKRSELLNQSEGQRPEFPVILVDTIGELGRIYAVGDVVFVGGSLIRHGGHNVLEPAAHGKPIIVGPNMFNFKDSYSLLSNRGACVTVNSQAELTGQLLRILSDDSLKAGMGAASYAVIEENRGAAGKSMIFLKEVLAGPVVKPQPRSYSIINWSSSEDNSLSKRMEFNLYQLLHGNVRSRWDIIVMSFFSFFSLLYGFGLAAKLLLYKTGLCRKNRLSCKVISLGNITLGGTGKTPTVKTLATLICSMGYKVAVLNRGYRAHCDKPVGIVSDGRRIYMSAYEAGDEAYLLAKQLPDVPVVIGKDRAISGEYVAKNMDVDVLIMDDGYQHWQLARDLDIVLVDTLNMFGNSCLLPRGTLREPLSHLDRADLFLLTKVDQSLEFSRKYVRSALGRNNPSAPVFESIHMPRHFIEIAEWDKESGEKCLPAGELCDKTAIAFSAIGNPASFEQTITDLGINLIEAIRYPDHHDYNTKEMEYIMERAAWKQAEAIITTEKDAVKIPKEFIALQRSCPLYILCIEVKLIGDGAAFQEILAKALTGEEAREWIKRKSYA